METYKRLPVAFVRGDGVYLYDDQDNAYFDALCGIAVTGLGHAHPGVTPVSYTHLTLPTKA